MKRRLPRARRPASRSIRSEGAAATPRPIAIHDEDVASCRAIGAHGAALVPDEARILTHCNAGALATAGYGTALGVIRGAVEAGKSVRGARRRDAAVPAGRAAHRVGAGQGRHRHDGDHRQHGRRDDAARARSTWWSSAPTASPPTATPPTRSAPTRVAVLAKEHGIPFYVAAPLSTIDLGDARRRRASRSRSATRARSRTSAPTQLDARRRAASATRRST